MTNKYHRQPHTLILLLTLTPDVGLAELATEWSINGDISFGVDYYHNAGDRTQSIYANTGLQSYTETNLNFSRRASQYEFMQGQAHLLLNDSAYRSDQYGGSIERWSLRWEKGDISIPFRLDLGDYYAFASARTIQQSLKGTQIELQPGGDWRQSLVAFAGTATPSWQNLDWTQDFYYGLSYLMTDEAEGKYAINLIGNRRDADMGLDFVRGQVVISMAGERDITLFDLPLTVEAEFAHLTGNVDNDTVKQQRNDLGMMLEVRNAGTDPLDYSLRFERYGRDFQPNGAAIIADRSELATRLGWRFAHGLALRGRAIFGRDDISAADPIDKMSLGVGLTGPLPGFNEPMNGSLDLSHTRSLSDNGTVDGRTFLVTAGVNWNINAVTVGRLDLNFQSQASKNQPNVFTTQLSPGFTRRFDLGMVQGSISPGLQLRQTTGGTGEGQDFGPAVGLELTYLKHSLALDYRYLSQNRFSDGAIDSRNHNANLSYNYATGQHRLSIATDYNANARSPGTETEGLRLGVTYTYQFDRPALSMTNTGIASSGIAPIGQLGLLSNAAPGTNLIEVVRMFNEHGLRGQELSDHLVAYETRIFEDIDTRQRLALLHDGPSLRTAMVILDLDDTNNTPAIERHFNRVRETLIRAFGQPANVVERGAFSPQLNAEIANGRVVRLLEWRLANGILRLGIPRRLDGQMRIEVHYARSLPPQNQTLWSIEELR